MFAPIALLGTLALAIAVPEDGTSAIAPSASPPPGCSPNYDGKFQLSTGCIVHCFPEAVKRNPHGHPSTLKLQKGILTDSAGRRGYIAPNWQLKFGENIPKYPLYTGGFTRCQNGSLALGATAIWHECSTSGGYYEIFYKTNGPTCDPVYLLARNFEGTGPSFSTTLPGYTSTPGSYPHTASSGGPSSTGSSKNASSGGLSSGEKIGLGVGVGLTVGCLLFGVVSVVYLRRRRSAKRGREAANSIRMANLREFDAQGKSIVSQP